jgi:serine protease
VINMSLGGGRSSVFERRAFDGAYSRGILSIASAGNDGNTQTSYPAGYDSVVSVAAVNSSGVVADFSQKNATVELSAPGVGVLSTVPFTSTNTLTVDGVTYTGSQIEFAATTEDSGVTGALVDGGLCSSATGSWSGKVVLCERGEISFYDKVVNVQKGGGTAAVIYNNAPGGFAGTLGAGNSSTIPAISLSQEDGQALVANKT